MAKLARLLLFAAVPILLVASPLYLFVTPSYASRAYTLPGFPPSRFAPAERERLSDAMVNYLRGRISLQQMVDLRTDAGEPALLPSEVQHMVDVKRVMDGFFIAHAVALVVALAATLLLLPRQPVRWALAVRGGIIATGGLIAVVAVAALADFDLFFTVFHRIFFQEGTWTFHYEDTLIQLYPLPFWTRAVRDMTVAIASLAALLYGASRWVERRALRAAAREDVP